MSKRSEELSRCNGMPVYETGDMEFKTYGRVLDGYDFSTLVSYMEDQTAIPESGNVYLPSVTDMENEPVKADVEQSLYGGMPVQIGYCNGRNNTYNGFEWHKGSEINIAVTDFMLVLGHTWDIVDKQYRAEQAEVFFVPKGTAIEMYQTTLHLSPCRTSDDGFKDIVILPQGTNTPLQEKETPVDEEGALLLMRNKWVIAHPDREPLIRQGAYAGMIGENKELFY